MNPDLMLILHELEKFNTAIVLIALALSTYVILSLIWMGLNGDLKTVDGIPSQRNQKKITYLIHWRRLSLM